MYMIELDEENFIRITRNSIKSFVNLSMFILRYYPPTRLASLSSSLTISFRIFSFFFQSHPFRFEDSKIISPIQPVYSSFLKISCFDIWIDGFAFLEGRETRFDNLIFPTNTIHSPSFLTRVHFPFFPDSTQRRIEREEKEKAKRGKGDGRRRGGGDGGEL